MVIHLLFQSPDLLVEEAVVNSVVAAVDVILGLGRLRVRFPSWGGVNS